MRITCFIGFNGHTVLCESFYHNDYHFSQFLHESLPPHIRVVSRQLEETSLLVDFSIAVYLFIYLFIW